MYLVSLCNTLVVMFLRILMLYCSSCTLLHGAGVCVRINGKLHAHCFTIIWLLRSCDDILMIAFRLIYCSHVNSKTTWHDFGLLCKIRICCFISPVWIPSQCIINIYKTHIYKNDDFPSMRNKGRFFYFFFHCDLYIL